MKKDCQECLILLPPRELDLPAIRHRRHRRRRSRDFGAKRDGARDRKIERERERRGALEDEVRDVSVCPERADGKTCIKSPFAVPVREYGGYVSRMTPRFSFSLLLRSPFPSRARLPPPLPPAPSRCPSRGASFSLSSLLPPRADFCSPFRSPRPSLGLFCVPFRVDVVVGAKRDAIRSLSRSERYRAAHLASDLHSSAGERHFYVILSFLFLRLSARVFLSHARDAHRPA